MITAAPNPKELSSRSSPKIARESLMSDAENPKLVLCENLEGVGREVGGRVQEEGDTCMHMANSC